MMEMIPAVKYKVCMLAPDHKYDDIKEKLCLFIGPCTFETNIYPFMLTHRDFDIYIIDLSYMGFSGMREQFNKLLPIMNLHRASIFAVWDKSTWQELFLYSASSTKSSNIVLCDTPDWCEYILCAISNITRFYSNEKS